MSRKVGRPLSTANININKPELNAKTILDLVKSDKDVNNVKINF